MAEEPWPRIVFGGKEFWQVESTTLIEVDPEGQTYFLVGTPQGNVGNLGPLVKGDPGQRTVFQEGGDLTPLRWDDPTPSSIQVVEVSPGSDTQPQVVKLVGALREGQPGQDGSTSIDLETVGGTVAAGRMLVVNPGVDGIDAAPVPVGGMHWPASLSNAPGGTNSTFVLGTVSVGSGVYSFDWRPRINAGCHVAASSSDARVDLVARLGAADGPVVGRATGQAGERDRLIVVSGPDAGAADGTNRVPAGSPATIYLVAEKQSGSATYSTSLPRFSVEVVRA